MNIIQTKNTTHITTPPFIIAAAVETRLIASLQLLRLFTVGGVFYNDMLSGQDTPFRENRKRGDDIERFWGNRI